MLLFVRLLKQLLCCWHTKQTMAKQGSTVKEE
jgi:hypothetical protein